MTQHLQLRQQASMAKWSRLISEQKNSGLTIRDFCRQHDLSWHAYYYWLQKIREQIVSELPSGSAEQQLRWLLEGLDICQPNAVKHIFPKHTI